MIRSYVPNAKSTSENIAPWTRTPAEAFAGWVESTKGHYENMVNAKYTHIGIGVVEGADGGYWWVQHLIQLN